MVNEGKAALAALTGYVLLCLEAAIILNATAAHFKGRDVLGAVFFGPDVDIVLPFALATAVLAVPIFLLFRAIFFVFQLTTWVASPLPGGWPPWPRCCFWAGSGKRRPLPWPALWPAIFTAKARRASWRGAGWQKTHEGYRPSGRTRDRGAVAGADLSDR
jgi:hypothetical protein